VTEISVLFLTRYPVEGASSRYRVYQYLPHLEKLGVRCDAQSFMDTTLYDLSFTSGAVTLKVVKTIAAAARRLMVLQHWRKYDIIFMQRELLPFGPPLIERYLRSKGCCLVFDYDDALFIKKASRYNPIATMLRSPNKVRQIMKNVDCVVAGNSWLRDVAEEEGARAVTIEVAEDTDRIPMHPGHTNARPLTIGWLGSPSTVKYLNLIAPVLERIARTFPRVRFELVGGGAFEMKGVDWQHTTWSLDGEIEALQRFDIGLMPLPSEDWAKGKSGGKARTYMAAGVVPVCTDVGYNRELIRHGETGFLCTDEKSWFEALSHLIEDPTLRQRIADGGRADVQARFSPAQQAARLRDVFDCLLAEKLLEK